MQTEPTFFAAGRGPGKAEPRPRRLPEDAGSAVATRRASTDGRRDSHEGRTVTTVGGAGAATSRSGGG